jgi:hypothetical protein
MNLSNEELEKELSKLKPKAPDQTLGNSIQARITESADNNKKTIRLWPVLAWTCAACIAVAAVFLVSKSAFDRNVTPVSSAQTDTDPLSDFEAVGAEQRLVEAIDDGVMLTSENEPVRRLRYQFIDSVTLVNHSDGSLFTMEVPREEILFVPVTLL